MARSAESPSPEGGVFSSQANIATGPHEQDDSEVPVQGGFLFITSSGQRPKQDRQQLRKLRGHVMHNYLERKVAEKHEIEPNGADAILLKSTGSLRPTMIEGQKLRFRMRSGELELRHPYRYRKGLPQKKEAAERKTVPKSTTAKKSSVLDERQLATDSGFVPGIPVTWLGSRRIDVFDVLQSA